MPTTKSGYTLIELLFVMGIVFLLAGISMVNHNQFGREIDLENTTYDIALTIRTAQSFGINRRDDLASSFDTPKPYGILFTDLDSLITGIDGVSSEAFMIFIDNEGGALGTNNLFDYPNLGGALCVANSSPECIDIITLNKGVYIDSLCAGDDAENCVDRDELHITFKRPDPDAIIKSGVGSDEHNYAEVVIASPVSGIKSQTIVVGRTGQISIK